MDFHTCQFSPTNPPLFKHSDPPAILAYFLNLKILRGYFYERVALKLIKKVSQFLTECCFLNPLDDNCGYFSNPLDDKYGVNSEALGSPDHVVEITF